MSETAINTEIHGGQAGIVGAQNVFIANLNVTASALPSEPSREADKNIIPPCPYPGLAYFGPQDSALFFGRETAIQRLEAALKRQALTALVGASGSGKSSVVLAGLAPRLHARGGWRFTHFRIGSESNKNPFLALARALVPLLGEHRMADKLEEIQKLATKLDSGAVNLSTVMGECRASNPSLRILLIADQFEELFTLVNDENLRNRFIETLLAGFNERRDTNPIDFCLVVTLRADFYGMALRYRPLADALQGRVENLGPMTRTELREAILRPAGTVSFEDGLVDTLLDDVQSQPGSLPLLQFALREMWAHLQKVQMTRATYDAIGGVKGALAKRAQAIFDTLTMDGKDLHEATLFRQLFTRLVSVGDGAQDARRVVGRDELGKEAWTLAQRLAGEENRLVVTSAPAADHETVELTHEALIRNWPTLVDWVDHDREFQSWLRQLKPRVDEWRNHPDDEGTLLRGGPLKTAVKWLSQRHSEINDRELSYIEASTALERDAAARDGLRLAEIKRARRKTRYMLTVVVALVGLITIGLVSFWKALWLKEHIYSLFFVHTISAQDLLKRPRMVFRDCSDCPSMVVLPPGPLTMGSTVRPDEQPVHSVTFTRPFAVGRYEVTVAEWAACVRFGDCSGDINDEEAARDRPVVNVSWSEAQQYVAWLRRLTGQDYGLLSEAEWEYAAGAGRPTYFSFSNDDSKLDEYAWFAASKYDPNPERRTMPVGRKKPNPFNLYDIYGNVSEWVEDCYHDNYRQAPTDGAAWISNGCLRHVIRGGSFLQSSRQLRTASRDWHNDKGTYDLGFRVRRRLPP